jgi:hypothetical protein
MNAGGRRIARLALMATLVAAAGAAWVGYRQPAFLLYLGNATWFCG